MTESILTLLRSLSQLYTSLLVVKWDKIFCEVTNVVALSVCKDCEATLGKPNIFELAPKRQQNVLESLCKPSELMRESMGAAKNS